MRTQFNIAVNDKENMSQNYKPLLGLNDIEIGFDSEPSTDNTFGEKGEKKRNSEENKN